MRTCGKENEEFIDIKEKDIKDFVIEIEKKYQKEAKEIRKDKKTLEIVIKEARAQTNVTIEELAQILDISKSTVWNYSNK